jgi:hypothetical protein
MRKDIYQLQQLDQDKGILIRIASYDSDQNISLEQIWHLCNARCWMEKFSTNGNHEIVAEDSSSIKLESQFFTGIANSDLVVEINDGYASADPFGWSYYKILEEAVFNLFEHCPFRNLTNKNTILNTLIK